VKPDDAPLPPPPPWKPAARPKLQPVRLTEDTLEEFLAWAAMVRRDEVDLVRSQIAAECTREVVAALGRKLMTLPVADCARHLMLLAVLGEARDPAALARLDEFVWTEGDILVAAEHLGPGGLTPEMVRCDLSFNMSGALRARAVEMVAYLNTAEAVAATIKAVQEHPEPDVRWAAIDAYLFNHEDSPEAADELRRYVRPEDLNHVMLPRRTRDMDPTQFDERLAELHRRGERPPVPVQRPD
jgi:HEAT repeat protein